MNIHPSLQSHSSLLVSFLVTCSLSRVFVSLLTMWQTSGMGAALFVGKYSLLDTVHCAQGTLAGREWGEWWAIRGGRELI